jgi:hypothetical protein
MSQPGKYGRLPLDPEKPRLIFERYLDPRRMLSPYGLPAVPATEDVNRSSMVPHIPMYRNDTLGDCTIAALGHMFGAWTVNAGDRAGEALFSDDEITAVYSRVGGYVPGDPASDNGCQCSDVLADAQVNGITGTDGTVHKLAGYAALGNPADEDLIAQVLEVFGSLYVGFNVQQVIETEFSQGKPWTWAKGAKTIGGHCVNLERRYPEEDGAGYLEYWTWGQRQRATAGWQAHAVEEAWVPVTQDWIARNGESVEGLDLTQLLADCQSIGGA